MYEVIWRRDVTCRDCNGRGWHEQQYEQGGTFYKEECRTCDGEGHAVLKETHTVSEATSGDCYSDELMGTQPGDDWALDDVVEMDPLDINDDGWER